ncbi:hypothetical protein MKX01_037167 [Papaver californicum]|nr:hypothetical protein MKX01_037167 [Papaver californicum]
MMPRNSNQGFRYIPNSRNGFVDPSVGPLAPIMTLPLDASGVPMAPVEAQQNGPVHIKTLASTLASANPELQRQMLGEQLFPLVKSIEHDYAGKVTGMLLEMDKTEVLHLIESPDALKKKVSEAMEVLKKAGSGSDAADQLGSLSLN